MADNKIRIGWDEVHSPQVDAKLRQQEAVARAAQHYPPAPTPGGHRSRRLPPAAVATSCSTALWPWRSLGSLAGW
jgi:hypothetical protein